MVSEPCAWFLESNSGFSYFKTLIYFKTLANWNLVLSHLGPFSVLTSHHHPQKQSELPRQPIHQLWWPICMHHLLLAHEDLFRQILLLWSTSLALFRCFRLPPAVFGFIQCEYDASLNLSVIFSSLSSW